MWYNKTTGELTAGSPWGHNGYFNPEKIPEFYPDWELVPDGFIPPSAPESQTIAPDVNQDIADIWEAIFALTAAKEGVK